MIDWIRFDRSTSTTDSTDARLDRDRDRPTVRPNTRLSNARARTPRARCFHVEDVDRSIDRPRRVIHHFTATPLVDRRARGNIPPRTRSVTLRHPIIDRRTSRRFTRLVRRCVTPHRVPPLVLSVGKAAARRAASRTLRRADDGRRVCVFIRERGACVRVRERRRFFCVRCASRRWVAATVARARATRDPIPSSRGRPAGRHPSVHRGRDRRRASGGRREDARTDATRDVNGTKCRARGRWMGVRGRGVATDEAAAVLFIHSFQEEGTLKRVPAGGSRNQGE